ncbi:2-Oxobutyrate oxidase, putative [Klebsiella pneumoniae]|uniref:2-Oxobutyrate oxidase, putative n=1 Tax=Klebsiella pneumoniae TaxID=573 RepID=A0A377X8U3_KLEPN|nr:2-Oxobutyrate oxidase, putative [Klebsiella pneumoniae]
MLFDQLYGDKPNEHIKLIRYPGQQETQSSQGVGAHKDSGFLSFLLQDEQKGLAGRGRAWRMDRRRAAGRQLCGQYWRTAGAGDQRVIWRATVHRVVSPPAQQQRLSIAFFLGAQLDAGGAGLHPAARAGAVKREGRTATRTIRCCAMSAGIISGPSAFPSGRGGTLLSGRVSRTRRAN